MFGGATELVPRVPGLVVVVDSYGGVGEWGTVSAGVE